MLNKALITRFTLEDETRAELYATRLFGIVSATRNAEDPQVVKVQIRERESSTIKCIEEVDAEFNRHSLR